MANKKAQWSTSNGRDSNAKRLGVKLFGGQKVVAGNIIIRQKGNKYYPSEGVSQWKDFTLFATADGTVKFFERKKTKYDGRKYVKSYVSIV
jgi:large subunit ribosomal protein L27